MVDAKDPEFCERLGHFLKTGGERVCRLGPLRDDLALPNFEDYSFEPQIENIDLILEFLHSRGMA